MFLSEKYDGIDLKTGRKQRVLLKEASERLKVSQPYLSLLEKGSRRVPEELARKATTLFGLSAVALPVNPNWENVPPADSNTAAADLACLGYPGFAYLKKPAEGTRLKFSFPH